MIFDLDDLESYEDYSLDEETTVSDWRELNPGEYCPFVSNDFLF